MRPLSRALSALPFAFLALTSTALANGPVAPPQSIGTTPFSLPGASVLRSLADRFSDVVDIMDHHATCDGVTNDAPALVEAQGVGQGKSFATISIPAGCKLNLGGATVYTVSSNRWLFGPGVKVINGSIQGLQDASVVSSSTRSFASGDAQNEAVETDIGLFNPTPGSTNYEKMGHYVRVQSVDPSVYTLGTLNDAVVAGKDAVGYESAVEAMAGNPTARLYGYHSQTTFNPGSDGNGNVAEFEMMSNAGTYEPQPARSRSKRVMHVTNLGIDDIAEGIEVDASEGGGRFHVGYDVFQRAIRDDGYAFGYWDSPANDMSRVPLAGIARDGTLIGQSLSLPGGAGVANTGVANFPNLNVIGGEAHYATGTYTDPQGGVLRSVKIAGAGLAVSGGGFLTGGFTADTLSLTGSQAASTVLAAPTGAAGAPAFRQLGVADISGAVQSQTKIFTSSGTWIKNPGAQTVCLSMSGMGGNGGPGVTIAAGGSGSGGGGGGAGQQISQCFPATLVPATVVVTIPAQSAPVSSGASSYYNGGASFGTLLYAFSGGQGGPGAVSAISYGGNGAASNGSAGNATTTDNGAGGFYNPQGGVGGAGGNAYIAGPEQLGSGGGGSSVTGVGYGPGGGLGALCGGAGGGGLNAGTAQAGAGGGLNSTNGNTVSGGAAGGGNGSSVAMTWPAGFPSIGGSGGGGNASGVGGKGGDAGGYGGGGGGGGSGTGGGGLGGRGGAAVVIVSQF